MDWLLDKSMFEHRVMPWLMGTGIFALTFLTLVMVKKLLLNHFQKAAGTIPFYAISADLLQKTKYITFFGLSLLCAAEFMECSAKVLNWLEKGVILLFLFQAGIWGTSLLNLWLSSLRKRGTQDSSIAASIGLIQFAAKAALFSTLLLICLSNFGINISALIAGLGVGGIAVALAAQRILGDLFASLTIVLDKPFTVGDSITVGDSSGTIEQIGLKTTRLRSFTGEQLIFSNADLVQSKIRNFKRMNERQITFRLQVVYSTPLEKLESIPMMVRTIIESVEHTRFDRAFLTQFGESSLDFEVVYWVTSPDYILFTKIHHSINLGILRQFQEQKIEFAYPTRVILQQS